MGMLLILPTESLTSMTRGPGGASLLVLLLIVLLLEAAAADPHRNAVASPST